VWRFVAAFEPAASFQAPGSVQIEVQRPGDYVIWLDQAGPMPDTARYSVQGPGGTAIAATRYGSMRSEDPGGVSVSVARFEAPVAGPYRVTVSGEFEPKPMSVAPSRLWPVFRLVVLLMGCLALGIGGAVAAALYGFLRAMPAVPGPMSPEQEQSLRTLVAVVYGLQAAAMLVGVTYFAAVIINYLRRDQAAGTWLESHFTWQIRTFWWSLAWSILGVATAVLVIGIFILLAAAVWYVYRVVRGWVELNEARPIGAQG
jgi:uncharacterized membrane protein